MATYSAGTFTLPMFSFNGSDSKSGEFTLPMFVIAGECGAEGSFDIPIFSFSGDTVHSGLSGQFVLPIPVMVGTTFANKLCSGTFRLPQFIFAGGSNPRISGVFTLPMFIFSSLAPGHGAGQFDLPIFRMYGFGRSIPPSRVYRGIVMNLSNQAMSTYSGFNFNSLACWQGNYYGINDTGIFRLGGDKDNLTRNIQSKMKFAPMNFGDGNIKHIRDMWITFRSDGHLQVTFSADENEDTTSISQTELVADAIREEKLKCGRGLKGRFFTVIIENMSGADFDIEQISILVDSIKRKLR